MFSKDQDIPLCDHRTLIKFRNFFTDITLFSTSQVASNFVISSNNVFSSISHTRITLCI